MDEFDAFNQTPQVPEEENTNIQEDASFGFGAGLDNTTDAAPAINTSSNDQQEDHSWVIENELTDTTTPPQSDIFSNDNLISAPQGTLSDDNNPFTNQSNNNEFDSYSTTDVPSKEDNVLYNDKTPRQSEDSSSYDMFSNAVPSASIDTNQSSSIGTYSTEHSSPLQAYNVRRQQEIAEKDAEEHRKIEDLRQQAKHDLERWYQDRNVHMEHKRQAIKNEEDVFRTKALEQSDKNSCDWSKVVRLLEFSQASQLSKGKRDLNRMKTSILQATRDKVKRTSENGV